MFLQKNLRTKNRNSSFIVSQGHVYMRKNQKISMGGFLETLEIWQRYIKLETKVNLKVGKFSGVHRTKKVFYLPSNPTRCFCRPSNRLAQDLTSSSRNFKWISTVSVSRNKRTMWGSLNLRNFKLFSVMIMWPWQGHKQNVIFSSTKHISSKK